MHNHFFTVHIQYICTVCAVVSMQYALCSMQYAVCSIVCILPVLSIFFVLPVELTAKGKGMQQSEENRQLTNIK